MGTEKKIRWEITQNPLKLSGIQFIKQLNHIDAGGVDPAGMRMFRQSINLAVQRWGSPGGQPVALVNRLLNSRAEHLVDIDGFHLSAAGKELITDGPSSGVMTIACCNG